MSRCFPFPPPGYERMHKVDDLDLLNEAKLKEKKLRKDKERRKDKVRDGGDVKEKHRDKKRKDRKSKNKDKKERDYQSKDKDKSSILEESTIDGKLVEENEGKIHPKKAPSSKDRGKPSQVIDDSKYVQELDGRIRGGENGKGSQLPEKVPVLDKRNQEMMVAAANASGDLHREKDDISKSNRINRILDPQGFGNEYTTNALAHNLGLMSASKVGRIPIPRLLDEQNRRSLEDKEKHDGICDNKQKHHRDKERKAKIEHMRSDPGKSKDNDGMGNDVGGFDSMSTNMLNNADKKSLYEAKIRKRTDMMDTNGFLRENEIRPQKIQRSVPHHSTENGRKLEAVQLLSKPSHDPRVFPNPNSVRPDREDKRINGVYEAQKPFSSKPNPPVSNQITEPPNLQLPHGDLNLLKKATDKVPKTEDQVGEASRKPPHPDSKYLAEVLTVPKMTDWSGIDVQDWLFGKKASTKSSGMTMEDKQHVWSEAVHIESAGICALPYVIPY